MTEKNNPVPSKPTVAIETLGCKVNQYESEAIAEALTEYGFTIVPFDEKADVYIINTCTVTAESDRKACQMIRRAVSMGEGSRPCVLVTGCMAQSQPMRAAEIEGVSYVCGSRNKMTVVEKAVSYIETRRLPENAEIAVFPLDAQPFEKMHIARSERTRAYIKIEDGCENRCTYCAIPGARGRVSSRCPVDILSEIRTLAENGYREVVLTGIEIASYGIDFLREAVGNGEKAHTYRLIDLLEAADRIEGIERIRLGSLEPTYMKPEIVSRMAKLRHLAPHFHLSLQSGSDHVLRMMHRKYTMAMLRGILCDIREKIPEVQFTTDIMTGFPGETEEDFRDTVMIAREARFLHIHVFPYSRRKNTPADTLPGQLTNEEKNRRANYLIALQKGIAETLYAEAGKTGVVVGFLPETKKDGMLIGHTSNFMEIWVAADSAGQVTKTVSPVRITGSDGEHLTGVMER